MNQSQSTEKKLTGPRIQGPADRSHGDEREHDCIAQQKNRMRQVVHDAAKQMRITPIYIAGQRKESKWLQLQSRAQEPQPHKKDECRSQKAKSRQDAPLKLFGNE